MDFAGIIAEYDPFHSGHGWQLEAARQMGARHVAVAMSCGMTQRGAPPLLPAPGSVLWPGGKIPRPSDMPPGSMDAPYIR